MTLSNTYSNTARKYSFLEACMKGSIYTDQKCYKCGNSLKYVENKGVLQCPDHPELVWNNSCRVKFGRKHLKRFKTVGEAERHLNYLRVQTDHGKYDIRDWQKHTPLSFRSLRKKFVLKKKQESIVPKHLQQIEYVLEKAGKYWDDISIKDIAEGEIDDFFNLDHKVGNKTLSNWKGVLTNFWSWIVKREKRKSGLEMPDFPDIKFKLGWRNIIDIETQEAILAEIQRISWDINPRVWLGILLLSIYPRIRPGEMRNVQEGHINLKERWIVFPQPKERDPKFAPLLPEHCDLIRLIWEPRALPHMFFFRHLSPQSGVQQGTQFGQKYFKGWWTKACKNLKIKDVDLYGGTKHSTVTALGTKLSPEQIQRGATGHASDAFKRYMLPDVNEALMATREIVNMRTGTLLSPLSEAKKKAK